MSLEQVDITSRRVRRVHGFRTNEVEFVNRYLGSNLGKPVSSVAIAQMLHLSQSRFCHAFKATFGIPMRRYLRTLRMDMASRLLAETTLPLIEVALECGMTDQPHFCKCFREQFVVTPGAWRKRNALPIARRNSFPDD
jgi:AraC family transcriptional regulator